MYIYILKLVKGKYYIGKSLNPENRISNHFELKGSSWTKKYPPIKTLRIIRSRCDYDEDKYTQKYMKRYGINNVRGGSFCSVVLRKETINVIKLMIRSSSDCCFNCGSSEHFARDCNFYDE
jgi:predicted GIY-YIG superfamily endonuclease